MLATLGVSGTPAAEPPAAPPCVGGQLRALYAVVPFSQGAGTVSYLLTVRNHSAQTCTLSPPPSMQLLDRRDHPLATRIIAAEAEDQVVLAPGQWVQAQSRFSPDIAGPGENPSECEPPAHALALEIGTDRVRVIAAGGAAYAVATLRTSAGPDEPLHGPCEPLATQVRVAPSRRGAALIVPVEPSLHACHGGAIALPGLYPAGS